ncbi:DMT family transporter [Pseudonocardia kongjuensis]|uniref:DMT family transporter n=2 Tax=Pseudonocardia kongjuensis TaxID=102227 RepID=A0ABN1XSC9_9PSEU
MTLEARSPSVGAAVLPAGFVVMWSSGYIGARLTGDVAPVATVMLRRFAVVALGLGMLLWLLRRFPRRRDGPGPGGRPLPGGREVAAHAVIGVLGQVIYIWANVGAVVAGVGAGTAALVAALQPIAAGAAAGVVLGERVSPRQWLGLMVGLVGVAIVVGGDLTSADPAPGWAYPLPLLGMVGLVAASLVERTTSAARTPMPEALAVQTTVSAAVFAVAALSTGGAMPPPDELEAFAVAVAWFVVLSTIGGYGFYWLTLRRHGLTRLSSMFYLVPPTTMLWAWLMFGDPVGLRAVAGLGLCALAVALVHLGPRPGPA